MKILKRKTVNELCEREVNTMLILADTYLFHEVPLSNYQFALDDCLDNVTTLGGEKWRQKAIEVFNEKVAAAKKQVEIDKKS